MRSHRHGASFGNILWHIEKNVSFVMLADLNKIVRTGICKQIHPFLGVPLADSKVLNKIIVNNMRPIFLQVVVVYTNRATWPFIKPPPIPKHRQPLIPTNTFKLLQRQWVLPLSIVLLSSDITPSRHGVDSPMNEDAVLCIVIPARRFMTVN